MILAKNRVPGQLLPVGTRYWYNAGRPINALRSVAGLSGLSEDVSATNKPVLDSPSKIATATAAGVGMGVVLGALLVRGGLGYVAGRAMAPSASKKNTYGWWGVVSGGMFGVTGLAVQGAVALSKKG